MIYQWIKSHFGLRSHTALSQRTTKSDPPLSVDLALTLSTVWACVNLISNSMASLPVNLFTKDENQDDIEVDDNLAYVLHDSPNFEMTAQEYWSAVYAQKLLWGNSFSLKHFRGTERKVVVALELMCPDLMNLRKNKDGTYTYLYSSPDGIKEYDPEEIFHLKNFSTDGIWGISTVGKARTSINNALAKTDAESNLYANGMRQAGALTLPNVLKKEQRDEIRKNIADEIGGVAKSGGVIILEAGMKYETLSMPFQDAEFLASKNFDVEEVCKWFGVPPILVGHSEKVTTWGSGIEQILIAFLTFTLTPHARNTEQRINKTLVPTGRRTGKGKWYAKINLDAFLRADSRGRAQLYNSASTNGWMTREEIRRKENLPYKKGSDKLTVQSALVNLEDLGKNVATNKPNPSQNTGVEQ